MHHFTEMVKTLQFFENCLQIFSHKKLFANGVRDVYIAINPSGRDSKAKAESFI